MAVPDHFKNVTQAREFVRYLVEREVVKPGAFDVQKVLNSRPRETHNYIKARQRARQDHHRIVIVEASRLAARHYEEYQVWCVAQRLAGKMKGDQK